MVSFEDVGVDYMDGDEIHLKGSVSGIVESDEICVVYLEPGISTHRNILSTVSSIQYVYFRGSSGDYDLAANGRYMKYVRDGYYGARIIDVSGHCGNWSAERAFKVLLVVRERIPELPDIFKYQLIFQQAELDDAYRRGLLGEEYRKYTAADQWLITPADPDCFTQLEPVISGESGDRETGWLCQAVEYGQSPCHPLPYWLCPLPSPETIYMRGECSCDRFRNTLQPLGIPCQHLIAAKAWYGSTVPYCPYVQCP